MLYKNMDPGFIGALRVLLLATALMLRVMAMPAHAAPVLPTDGNVLSTKDTSVGASPPAAKSPGIIDGTSVTDVPNQSKTVEMLLEMQGKNPGLEGGEMPRQEMPSGGRKPPGAQNAAPAQPFGVDDPANPFAGAGLTPNKAQAVPQDSAVDWTEAPPSRFGGGVFSSSGTAQRDSPGRSAPAVAEAEDADMRWLIPRSVVRFVRQNREMVVIGSVLLLLLLWAASAFASGRRK